MASETKKRERDPSMDYIYLPIVDALKAVNLKVNLFGVITSIREPKMSRGTDYVQTLKIMDPSFPRSAIAVNFFALHASMLPEVKSLGDIISLHQVTMKLHNGESYCVCDKRFSSYALFEKISGSGSNFYQASESYRATTHDEQFLSQLRAWIQSHPPELAALFVDQSLQLQSLKCGFHPDIICKVLYMSIFNGEKVLYVWDGTDTPPAQMEVDLDLELKLPCPLYLEPPLPIEVVSKFPRIGSVLTIFCGEFSDQTPNLEGDEVWVKLAKISCKLQAGLWSGTLHASSTVERLSISESIVTERLKVLSERLRPNLVYPLKSFPSPSSITEIDCVCNPYATLRESLGHQETSHKLISIVRVVAACPWKAVDLISPVTGRYRVRLTLEDPTARIHAYISGEEGAKFFQGYPTADVLARKMAKLLGIFDSENSRDPPWIQCCLKSYMDKSNERETRRYKIFATTLVGWKT